ncbi:hypothetical protein K7472_07540 [Streptomyces sp. PTM05]|uniref:Uncharacterized protein n=1 Tax=Streptantibioticus parmotrematis TaxID=2873249 RepID=A0ABS7QNE1_9ACTN|nr:hypothetical protein [Streptantibioticus parmotrematis]MBY8884696.1 hypothetical protein [Streptantibioticus parmotrematis]
MSGHIAVNTNELRTMGRTMATLRSDFEHGSDLMNSFSGYIGSGELAGALGDFSTDWSKKRDELCKGLQDLGDCVTKAAETYDGVDGHLASALLKAEAGKGGAAK